MRSRLIHDAHDARAEPLLENDPVDALKYLGALNDHGSAHRIIP
jgi:hypothetical protein